MWSSHEENERWVLLSEDRMIREPDDQVRGMLAGGVAIRG
jgi:hypothetical protein